jgi:tRNA G46 methylase TrmB
LGKSLKFFENLGFRREHCCLLQSPSVDFDRRNTMVNVKQALTDLSAIDLEQRKRWYSPAAVAYNEARPRYPQALMGRAIATAGLSADSRVLEIGCGPGTATVALAPLGCELLCLEPNVDFYGVGFGVF